MYKQCKKVLKQIKANEEDELVKENRRRMDRHSIEQPEPQKAKDEPKKTKPIYNMVFNEDGRRMGRTDEEGNFIPYNQFGRKKIYTDEAIQRRQRQEELKQMKRE